ncbi:hypothetical protein BJ138DRAFT_1179847 [Hygrophoropsis aurantiaca]|uniref:Uncharacterized protein n=1 Tax=Hygrophoropsis aurantiaca TaxID=72124 RepID=A0ACB8AD12_9AGAM|nr:hypothetical protein BJ138DRAFT_1179847 [Hygrophoropsis aurantiaca]
MSDAATIALHLQMVKYFKISGMAILAYDYCLNFDMERSLAWSKPWGFVRILFVLARYIPFIEVPIDLYFSFVPKSVTNCQPLYEAVSWLNIIGTITAEALLLIRTWVLWGKNRAVLVGLIALAIACIAGSWAVGAVASKLVKYVPPPLSTAGCYQSDSSPLYVWNYVILAVFELVNLLLTIYQAIRRVRHSRNYMISRDGILYISCILVMAVMNIIVITALPTEYSQLIDTLQAVMNSVLASRLIFNMRRIMRDQQIGVSRVSSGWPLYGVEMPPMSFLNGSEVGVRTSSLCELNSTTGRGTPALDSIM